MVIHKLREKLCGASISTYTGLPWIVMLVNLRKDIESSGFRVGNKEGFGNLCEILPASTPSWMSFLTSLLNLLVGSDYNFFIISCIIELSLALIDIVNGVHYKYPPPPPPPPLSAGLIVVSTLFCSSISAFSSLRRLEKVFLGLHIISSLDKTLMNVS